MTPRMIDWHVLPQNDKVSKFQFSAGAKNVFYDGILASRKATIFAREIYPDFFINFMAR